MNEGGVKPEEYLFLVDEILRTRHYRSVLRALRIEYDDAYQIGAVGLVRAANAYNPDVCEFPKYAFMRIKRELNHYFCAINRMKRKVSIRSLSLNMPLRDGSSTELLEMITDKRELMAFDSVLTNIMLDKLQGQEKQLLQLLYHRDIGRGPEARQKLQLKKSEYYRILKSLKAQIMEIFDEPNRRGVNVI